MTRIPASPRPSPRARSLVTTETAASETLTSGELARRVGVGVETIRFYEREKLLAVPRRSASGYRRYPLSAVTRLHFITRAKRLGFTLREIRELLDLREGGPCDEVRIRAEAKLEDVRARILELRRIERALRELAEACSIDETNSCPILAALDAGDAPLIHEPAAPSREPESRVRRVGRTREPRPSAKGSAT